VNDDRRSPYGPGMAPSDRDARHALIAGVVVVAAYAALAAWSGALSSLARGPLLDGAAPVNYRWVSPPPELRSTNQRPSAGRFDLALRDEGVRTQVLFTDDSQVTVVIDDGSIGPATDQRAVELVVEPVDPAGLAPPPGGELEFFGNAYEIGAAYRPSERRVRAFDRPIEIILVYPATATLHATSHEMLYSSDGEAWQTLETSDFPGAQQAAAKVGGSGFVVVAGVPSIVPSPSVVGPSTTAGTPPLAIALLVAAGVVLVIGLGLLIRSRGTN
jgi:hypothetical protein